MSPSEDFAESACNEEKIAGGSKVRKKNKSEAQEQPKAASA